jgi:hypothetical protein
VSARSIIAFACLACGLPGGAAELARDAARHLWTAVVARARYPRRPRRFRAASRS